MNFVPLPYYSFIYFQFLLLVVFAVLLTSVQSELTDEKNIRSKEIFGKFILLFVILYLGLRPISAWFGDMIIYNIEFQDYVNGAPFDIKKDFIFECMKFFYAKYLNAETFFFTCAFLYVFLLYVAAKKMFKDYWFYAFLMFIVAFTFWAYGTNGIRNGLATSVFIYAISRDKKASIVLLLIVTYFVHKGMLIPILAFIITNYYSNSKAYLSFWIFAIPLSFVVGGFFETFFLGLGFGDEKLTTYLGSFNQASEGVELVAGFRWDFLLYSASGAFAGWFFIVKKGFQDVLYQRIFNTYLIANGIWILIIRANYSNRFAFLSWFLLGLVIIYPLLKSRIYTKQHIVIVRIVIIYFSFCYLMNVILKK